MFVVTNRKPAEILASPRLIESIAPEASANSMCSGKGLAGGGAMSLSSVSGITDALGLRKVRL